MLCVTFRNKKQKCRSNRRGSWQNVSRTLHFCTHSAYPFCLKFYLSQLHVYGVHSTPCRSLSITLPLLQATGNMGPKRHPPSVPTKFSREKTNENKHQPIIWSEPNRKKMLCIHKLKAGVLNNGEAPPTSLICQLALQLRDSSCASTGEY